jgi:Cu+-exporting ATPase
MDKCIINVSGLDCATCAEKIKKHLLKEKGVSQVEVFLGSEKVEIIYDKRQIGEKEISDKIKELGYKIKDVTEEKAHKHFAYENINLFLIILVLGLVVFGFLFENNFLEILATIIGGTPLVIQAIKDIKNKSITADVFMSLGVVASALIGEFRSAAVISLFMLISEYIDSFTIEKSRKAIKSLIEQAPKVARVKREDGEVEVPIDEVKKGDIVIIRSGEKIPVEGIVINGHGVVNQAVITGESMPVEKKVGDTVFAATINEVGVLFIKVMHVGEDTTYSKIIKLVQEAESAKAKVQRVADKFSTYFTPLIIIASLTTYFFTNNIQNAIAVVVVACPCAVAIATPLAVVAGVGLAAKHGIIIKGGKYLEALASIDTIVMDKTGTLTIGTPAVTELKSFNNFSVDEVIEFASAAEMYSEHPLAKAIRKFTKKQFVVEPEKYKILPSFGISMVYKGRDVLFGSKELLNKNDIIKSHELMKFIEEREMMGETVLTLVVDNIVAGAISVADQLKEETKEVIKEFGDLNIKETYMLTGDNEKTARTIAERLNIKHYRANLKPEDKVKEVKKLIEKGRKVLMVGDGINDAPALAQSNVGMAMGAMGSDIAIESADVVIMNDDWRQIPKAIKIGRKTFKIIKHNLVISILFNIVGIGLASTGMLSPVMAAFAHVIPDVLVFLNSSRLLKKEV